MSPANVAVSARSIPTRATMAGGAAPRKANMRTDARFFDDHQRRTVEAAMARIIPADHQPGAREAGVIDFLDRYLSGIDYIFAKPDGSGFERLDGLVADA